ncbi:translation machinery-associated protein 16-like [Ornithodoros turicata]|uniref:translation machinery-associated protein 16-like n=1 Tax=Ornithodoros turicata TaxID=34597 RepID=UPI00313997FD
MGKVSKQKQQKAIHPNSRKAQQLGRKQIHKNKVKERKKQLTSKLRTKLDKLAWFHNNIAEVETRPSPEEFHNLIEKYFHRFDDELEHVRTIEDIRGTTLQYKGRMDAIKMTSEKETTDYMTCGLEVPDLLNAEAYRIFREWDGSSVSYFPKITMKMYSKAMLETIASRKN